MTFTEALQAARRAPAGGPEFRVKLACGFTPLHLQTFLTACLLESLPDRRVVVEPGLYGDLAGTIETIVGAAADPPDVLAVVLEWPDLDPRLGFRAAGSWSMAAISDILSNIKNMLARIADGLSRAPTGCRIAIVLPTLPLPPLFHTAGWQASEEEMILERDVLAMALELTRGAKAVIVNRQRLAEQSPAATRFDLKSDLLTGLPYTVSHANAVAAALKFAIVPQVPKKAIITDLDDTLWSGIVGEIGSDAVSWDLVSHHQLHGLYQKTLASLSENGVLIGIASKNDPAVVHKTLERPDMLIPVERIFPIEVHWSAKSGSVSRILNTWNISADSVLFIDDSPMELAEVAAAHPGIETVCFPKDYAAGLAMLRRLRDLFGKERISKEDTIRLDSIRRSAEFQQQTAGGSASEDFLRRLDATVSFDFQAGKDPRTLELVNKTNQFNLNGLRLTESDWQKRLARPDAFVAGLAYEDKFGMLGTIAVIQGYREQGDVLRVSTWVMSCRAFARRIEHRCLEVLFDQFQVNRMEFDFIATERNGPLQDFLTALTGAPPCSAPGISRQQFQAMCPPVYHKVAIKENRTE